MTILLVLDVFKCVTLSITLYSLIFYFSLHHCVGFHCPHPFPLSGSPSPTHSAYPPPTSTLHPTFPPPLSPEQVWWPPWPPEPFHVVIHLASLGQSPCSSNLLVAGYLHRLELQASTSSMCPLCHHILSHTLFFFFFFCHFDLTSHQLPMLKRPWNMAHWSGFPRLGGTVE